MPVKAADKNTISKKLRQCRREKSWTQEQLSEESGVAVRTIQRIENGQVEPHLQTISLLANSLGLEVNDLVKTESEENLNSSAERKWLLLLHISPLVGFIIPFANFIVPLFIWIYKKDDHPLYNSHGKAVANFHLTIILFYIASVGLLLVSFEVGMLLLIITMVYNLALIIINARRITIDKAYKYPLTINFL